MIKVSTYAKQSAAIDFRQLPPVMEEAHNWMLNALPYYDASKAVQETADLYLKKLEELKGGKPEGTQEPKPTASNGNEAQEAIEFLEILLDGAKGAERQEIEEAIEFIKLL